MHARPVLETNFPSVMRALGARLLDEMAADRAVGARRAPKSEPKPRHAEPVQNDVPRWDEIEQRAAPRRIEDPGGLNAVPYRPYSRRGAWQPPVPQAYQYRAARRDQ